MFDRLSIGCWSKRGLCSGFRFEKVKQTKIQSIFQEKWSKKVGNLGF
jgi:hypothetical protein